LFKPHIALSFVIGDDWVRADEFVELV